MASYQGHLMFSSVLGTAYGCVGVWRMNLDWGPAFLGAGVTTLGGLLPDLDSDSGVPVRELFGLAAAIIPLLFIDDLMARRFSMEQIVVVLGAMYLFIRYGLSSMFKKHTVHRGMFHSIPAMLIAGLAVYLCYPPDSPMIRLFIAGGVMLGFLSHLVLDEIYAVDFMGVRVRLNRFAGSALKFWSPSVPATLVCYALLGALGYLAWGELR